MRSATSNAFSIVVAHLVGTVTVAAIGDPQNGIENSLLTVTAVGVATACAAGPYTWSVSPALPAGATFSTSTGVDHLDAGVRRRPGPTVRSR